MIELRENEIVIAGHRIPFQIALTFASLLTVLLTVLAGLGIYAGVTGDVNSSRSSDRGGAQEITSEYKGAFDLGKAANDPLVGGLSGIEALGPGKYIAISDDKGEEGPVRAYHLTQDGESYGVGEQVTFADKNGTPYAEAGEFIDAEEIRVLPNGNFLWTTEGRSKGGVVTPQMIESTPDGKEVRRIDVPAHHVPDGSEKKGVQDNKGAEGLALLPGGTTAVTVTERPLAQDRGNRVRVTYYDLAASKATKEYVVPVSLGRGVSAAIADENGDLYILERGFNEVTKKNSGEIFKLDSSDAEDVLGKEKLDGKEKAVDKQSVFKFAEHPDNVEGLAWGAKTAEGKRTLLVITDNNFSDKQRTLIHTIAL